MPSMDELIELYNSVSDEEEVAAPSEVDWAAIPTILMDGAVDYAVDEVKVEEEPLPEYFINPIFDTDHPDCGYALVDEENPMLIHVHLAEGYESTGVNVARLHEKVQDGQKKFSSSAVLRTKFDPAKQVSCKWLVPSVEAVQIDKAVLPEDYPYDREPDYPICMNPAIKKKVSVNIPPCMHADQPQNQCDGYESSKWTKVRETQVATPSGLYTLTIETRLSGEAVPTARVLHTNNGATIPVQIVVLRASDFDEDFITVVNQFFDGYILESEPIETHEVEIETTTVAKEKVKYLEYVLSF